MEHQPEPDRGQRHAQHGAGRGVAPDGLADDVVRGNLGKIGLHRVREVGPGDHHQRGLEE